MCPQLSLKNRPAANRRLPHRLYLSITDKCSANCTFCSFRDMQSPTYNKTGYLALTMGSLHQADYAQIIGKGWQDNEFLRAVFSGDIYKAYCGVLKKHAQPPPARSFFSCDDCYRLRSSGSLRELFNIKTDYPSGELSLKQWQSAIEAAHSQGVRELVFADAGEPVEEPEKLCSLLDYAKKKFKSLTVFTNGYFAGDTHAAYRLLQRLKNSGLTDLGVSCDFHSKYKFHQSFVPIDNIVNIVKAARKLKIDVFFSSLFLEYSDAVKLKNILESMIGKKLVLCNADWDELEGVPDILRYFLHILSSRKSIFKKDVFFANKVRLNPRVEAAIAPEDLFLKKCPSNRLPWLKKMVYQYTRPCFKSQVILSNGLVVCCAMNTY